MATENSWPGAGNTPALYAVFDETRRWRYGDLSLRVTELAAHLRYLRPHCVALYAENSPEWLVVDLACQMSGTTLLPLPLFFSGHQLRHAVDACGVDLLLTDRVAAAMQFYSRGREAPALLPYMHTFARDGITTSGLPEGTGKITFTSGSTGQPKGVCLSHSQQRTVAAALAQAVGLEQPRHLCVLPLSTLLENIAGVYAPLLNAGEIVVPSLATMGFEGSRLIKPRHLLETIARVQPHSLILLPQLLSLLVNAVRQGWQSPRSLKFIAVGGARVAPRLLAAARRLGLPIYEGYGLSECASVVSLNTPRQDCPGSVGRPLPHLDVRVENDEILVRGNVQLGYVGEPASWFATAVNTGDLGHLDDAGFLHLRGRRKNLLISSFGRNIHPEWLESELLAQPVIAQAVALGDGQPYCAALIVPRLPDVPDVEIQAAIDAVNAELPDYARIVRWHRLRAPLESVPELLTDNGRPRRDLIRRHFAEIVAQLYPEEEIPL